MTLDLVIATLNEAKADRLRAMVEGLDIRCATGTDLPDAPEIDEGSGTHLAAAVKKALGWSTHVGGIALASDGGLVIPALGDDWESTLTKRQTGAAVPDEERARRLLTRMRELTGQRREAYWAEAIAIARNGTLIGAWETDGLPGIIGFEFRPPPGGSKGFWADSLWETTDGRKRWELLDDPASGETDPWAVLAPPVRAMLARLVESQARGAGPALPG